ncbi:putative dentin sialophosphoprotein [Sesbania bispinosa]|nr:putative dentin sialophosphoprotein [Sesbania bispinosa]
MLAPMVEENDASYRGRSESKDEIPLSELLDLEIRWPSEAERTRSSNSDSTLFPGKSSLNLVGVDLDSFFDRRESDSDVSEQNLASGRQVSAASDDTFPANENLSLFQNVQASEVAAGSAEEQSGDSFSGWEANFKSASSDPVREEFKSADHSKVESDTVSGDWNNSVGLKKNDDSNPSDSESTENDWFQGDERKTSMGLNHAKTSEIASGSSTRNFDWMQDDQCQGCDNKTPVAVPTDEADDSFDAWNDFTGSASTQDPSSIISTSEITDQTGKSDFSADLNERKTAEGASSSSNKDLEWMQDNEWQYKSNKTTDKISTNEAADSFDAWNDFTGSANMQYSSSSVSQSEITSQTGKFELTKYPNDTKTAEIATGSPNNFDWMQDDKWSGSNNRVTGIVTTNEVTDSFDAWNDFTGSAISQNPSSSVSNSEVTSQTGKSEITAGLNDTKTAEGADASSVKSFDWMQDDQWQVSNNNTTDIVTTNAIADSFDVWDGFTSLATTQDPSSNVWNQTVNQNSAEKSSETNLFGSSNNSHDMDFSGFSQHGLFSGQFNNPVSFPAATNSQAAAASSNRVDDVDTTRGNSGDVTTAEVGSKDDAEMLMSQMHDLSFMLESNLSIPPK